MLETLILVGLFASCVTVCLLLLAVRRRRTPPAALHRRDGLDGVREVRAAPVPHLPTAGAAVAAPTEVVVAGPGVPRVPQQPANPAPANPAQANPAQAPAPAAGRLARNNSRTARFGPGVSSRAAGTVPTR